MTIEAEQERRFYDEAYAVHLDADDGALRCDRKVLLQQFDDPASPLYERRRLYRGVLDALVSTPLRDLRVLDYGCGTGEWGVMMATEGARVALLDLSPIAIEVGLRRAQASGVAGRVEGYARDASDLSCFRDGEFDLIYASAAIHHTMKYPNALAELLRVLKPGSRLVLAEGYGNNPILNAARRFRWWLSREPTEAGEGLIFAEADLDTLRRHMTRVEVTPLNLFAMAKRLFRGRFPNPAVRGFVRALEMLDSVVLTTVPPLKRFCGELIVVAEK